MANRSKGERTKDRLLDNCSEAIKQLQIESCHLPDTVFTGGMWQVQELCQRIDNTFNHGLKRAADGYWDFVQDLSHKSVISIIESLPSVQTNSEKGYAWIHLALNDHALESYLRNVLAHPETATLFYLPHALLRDSQRIHLLIMLVAGLEHLPFNLNWNDTLNYKRGSVTTVDSELGCDSGTEEADCTSLGSCSLSSYADDPQSKDFEDHDDPEIGVITYVTFDPETGQPIKFIEENEIVHSSIRMTRKCKKERPINNNLSGSEDATRTNQLDEISLNPQFITRVGTPDRERFLDSILNNKLNLFTKEEDSAPKPTDDITNRSILSVEEVSVYDNNSNDVLKTGGKCVGSETKSEKMKVSSPDIDSDEMVLDMSERGVPEGQEDPMITSTSSSVNNKLLAMLEKSKLNGCWLPILQLPLADKTVVQENSAKFKAEINSELVEGKEQQRKKLKASEVFLDNNFLLMIMLEVVIDQEEKVYKVYRGMTGHTVGSPLEIFVVLTDQRLYLTRCDGNGEHFQVNAAVPHSEIEFIQFGLNGQLLNIVCTAPRRRLWISTGDEESSANIVSSLEVSMRRNPKISSSALPGVYTQATMQSIALRKWVAKQMCSDNFEDIQINHYALIRWEDPHTAHFSSDTPAGPSNEGFLMYLYTGSQAIFGNDAHWRPAFFRLKAGVLYHFNDPLDTAFRNYVQLVDGECVGCRHLRNVSRPHTFEILLSEGRSLCLAASSEDEASIWLQMILQSVAQGYLGEEVRSPCVSACLAIAADCLFICHEQLEENSFSLLAKVHLQDVSSIYVESTAGTMYCIVEFESVEATESNGDWVLYFASEKELSKFVTVMQSVWSALYKVPLAINNKLDPALQKRFHSSQHFYTSNLSSLVGNRNCTPTSKV